MNSVTGMQINVAQLLKALIGAERTYKIAEAIDIGDEHAEAPVSGEVRMLRTEKGVFVEAELWGKVMATCSRCLMPCELTLDIDFKEEFFPSIDVGTGQLLPLPEDPEAFTIDQNHILDLTEAVRQYAVIALSLKPLCQPQCLGLCPNCGQNLNEGPCQCPRALADPRWTKLRELTGVLVEEE